MGVPFRVGRSYLGQRLSNDQERRRRAQRAFPSQFFNPDYTTVLLQNDALFWYNLHRDGQPDLLTRHAGCPVLMGDKWVSNKWIRERGNEFRRPCALKPFINELYVGDVGDPAPNVVIKKKKLKKQ